MDMVLIQFYKQFLMDLFIFECLTVANKQQSCNI